MSSVDQTAETSIYEAIYIGSHFIWHVFIVFIYSFAHTSLLDWTCMSYYSKTQVTTHSSIHRFTEKHPEFKTDCGPTTHRQKTQKAIILTAGGAIQVKLDLLFNRGRKSHYLWETYMSTLGNMQTAQKKDQCYDSSSRDLVTWGCKDVKWRGKRRKLQGSLDMIIQMMLNVMISLLQRRNTHRLKHPMLYILAILGETFTLQGSCWAELTICILIPCV